MKSHFQADSRLKVSDQRHLARRYLADGAQGYRNTLAPLGTIKDSFASQARRVGTIQSEGHFRSAHAGPHLGSYLQQEGVPRSGRIGVHQSGRERMSCSDLSSGLTLWIKLELVWVRGAAQSQRNVKALMKQASDWS